LISVFLVFTVGRLVASLTECLLYGLFTSITRNSLRGSCKFLAMTVLSVTLATKSCSTLKVTVQRHLVLHSEPGVKAN
uniref:Uncharacterized protein n=1 Tax=Parascaris univalens TaxID=6257 RepID=A0A915ATI6_PARUN